VAKNAGRPAQVIPDVPTSPRRVPGQTSGYSALADQVGRPFALVAASAAAAAADAGLLSAANLGGLLPPRIRPRSTPEEPQSLSARPSRPEWAQVSIWADGRAAGLLAAHEAVLALAAEWSSPAGLFSAARFEALLDDLGTATQFDAYRAGVLAAAAWLDPARDTTAAQTD